MRNVNKKDLVEAIKNKRVRISKCSKLPKRKFKKLPVKVFTAEEIKEYNEKSA